MNFFDMTFREGLRKPSVVRGYHDLINHMLFKQIRYSKAVIWANASLRLAMLHERPQHKR